METGEKQCGNELENTKIDCKSKRSINALLETLKEQLSAHNFLASEGDKVDTESINRRIYQTYRRAFLTNVLVDGQVINDAEDEDTTSEFEPFDAEKEHYIQHDLMNKFDQQLVNTTRLRKTGPHIMKSHLKKIIRPELKYLALVNVVPEKKDDSLPDPETTTESVREDIEARLHNAFSTVESTQQSCEETLVKSRDLLQALKLYQRTEESNTYQVMCETPPQTPVTVCSQNKNIMKCEINKKLLL